MAPFRSFFALVVGIDRYSAPITPLKGAVADARAVRTWLVNEVGVDSRHITMLLDERATRANIIKAFEELMSDKNINKGDPILIYYAGHGAQAWTPRDWIWVARGSGAREGGNPMEVILPYDAHTKPDGKYVPPIPDITIKVLLAELAAKRGDNITVIFDCSFSRGMMRGDEGKAVARATDLWPLFTAENILPYDLDNDIFNRTQELRHIGGTSHTLLTACGEGETACEDLLNGTNITRGRFTVAFINALTPWDNTVTYVGLTEELDIYGNDTYYDKLRAQNPQCKGTHIDRRLFNGKLPERDPTLIRINCNCTSSPDRTHRVGNQITTVFTQDEDVHNLTLFTERNNVHEHQTGSLSEAKPTLFLAVGKEQGFITGSMVTVHTNYFEINNPPIFRMRVANAETLRATLTPEPAEPTPATLPVRVYAKQYGWHETQALRVHLTPALIKTLGDGPLSTSDGQFDSQTGLISTRSKGEADLVVDLENRTTVFRYSLATQILLLPVLATPTYSAVLSTLRRAVSWSWNLKRGEEVEREDVSLDFMRLRDIKRSFSAGIWEPDGEDLNIDGVVRTKFDADARYGFKLTNKTKEKLDLHVTISWFDTTTLNIEPIYRGAAGRKQKIDPTLRADSDFTVGYGARGVEPLKFPVPSRNDCPVGFVKVVITYPGDGSTRPSTLRNLGPMWYTITLPVIMT